MDIRPCSADPDLWFGYADDDASDGAAKARV
jgi:WhiB family redox-sensing transcriptional regulator